jgi:hypothetical protein
MFELQPKSKKAFGFPLNYDPSSDPIGRMGLSVHAKSMIDMLDNTLSLVSTVTDSEKCWCTMCYLIHADTLLTVRVTHYFFCRWAQIWIPFMKYSISLVKDMFGTG